MLQRKSEGRNKMGQEIWLHLPCAMVRHHWGKSWTTTTHTAVIDLRSAGRNREEQLWCNGPLFSLCQDALWGLMAAFTRTFDCDLELIWCIAKEKQSCQYVNTLHSEGWKLIRATCRWWWGAYDHGTGRGYLLQASGIFCFLSGLRFLFVFFSCIDKPKDA